MSKKTESYREANPVNFINIPLSSPEQWLVWEKNNSKKVTIIEGVRWIEVIEKGKMTLETEDCQAILLSNAIKLLSNYA